MADVATLQTRLLEAEFALHKLMTGAATVEVENEDMRMRYTSTNVGDLRAYIQDLKNQLVDAGALSSTDAGRRKPVYLGGL